MDTVRDKFDDYGLKVRRQRKEIQKRIVGMHKFIEALFVCFYSHSENKLVPHLLVEGAVGRGKTVTLETFARTIDGVRFLRVQFTPDLLPQDLIMRSRRISDGTWKEFPGPLLSANLLLADEINRANEKTGSALLEAMGEEQVTLDDKTIALDRPFFVMATKNPTEVEGTFRIGEARLDRFLMQVHPDPLTEEEEIELLRAHHRRAPEIIPVLSKQEVMEIRDFIRENVFLHVNITRYALHIVRWLRPEAGLIPIDKIINRSYFLPEGQRAVAFLERAAKTLAFLRGRTYVIPGDIDELAIRVLGHRVSFLYDMDDYDPNKYILEAIRRAREDDYGR